MFDEVVASIFCAIPDCQRVKILQVHSMQFLRSQPPPPLGAAPQAAAVGTREELRLAGSARQSDSVETPGVFALPVPWHAVTGDS